VGRGGAAVPIRSAQGMVGVLGVGVELPREITPVEMRLLNTLAEIAGSTIERMSLYEQAQRQVKRLAALRNVDIAISGTLELRVALNVLLEQVIDQLHVDAADVLLLNPSTYGLEFAAGQGFATNKLQHVHLHMGEGHAGRAALERRCIVVPNLNADIGSSARASALRAEKFVAYYAMPLVAKGEDKGLLEVFHRMPLDPDAEWLDFFEALAGQAAIAIDNAQMFGNLERANVELRLAYNTTIEGWSRALDLRDKETEGHTQRVTELTLRLARQMGIAETELVHIRRGALLHDIGKMGVPDHILLKPGPLTEEEWVMMRKHPVYAYELLSSIAFLRQALDIPYCHHEKWDGTGYPRALKGDQIPLAARLFAVVDVWDALRADRPYRAAWSEQKVREHLQSLSGTHFDPRAVEMFLQLLGDS
jgi:putative nucleotidyltransferase with HDIG domain